MDNALPASPKKEFVLTFNAQTMFSALLILLVFVSVAQMIQLVALKRTVSTGIFSTPGANAATPSTPPAGGGALPNMVGGC